MAINELKRTTGIVTLKFTIYNDADKGFSIYGKLNGDGFRNYANVSGVHLIDAASKKKYFVVADSDKNCLCSDNVPEIATKSQAAVWAKFPAPPDDVQKITVEIPHFIPMEDVAISR